MGFMPRTLLSFLCSVLAIVTVQASSAYANPRYAAYVIHAETGDVLFSRYGTAQRYPASLTKMMTLYMLFEALEAGELKLTDGMKVSRRASLQPASRLGLSKGSYIKVENAIEALVIRSANDVATVVAEELAGTESQFAVKMTEKARELGMRQTTFRNASGLPDRRQVTTAKDMAILSQRIVQDFPKYYHYFDQNSFTWGGRTYSTHNRVAKNYSGADGIKTGYTRASGYNLATSAQRGDHRLIGIVLGGRSSRTRDRHMEAILTEAFNKIQRRPHLVSAIHRVRPIPSLRPDRDPNPAVLVLVEPENVIAGIPVPRPKPNADTARQDTLSVAALQATLDTLTTLPDGTISAVNDFPAPIAQGDADMPLVRNWVIQVGAYHNQQQAIDRIRSTQELVLEFAGDARREVNIADRGAKAIYRARFTDLTADEAADSCSALRADGQDCLALLIER